MILGFSFPFSLYHLTYINNINNISPLCFEFIFCYFFCELEDSLQHITAMCIKSVQVFSGCYA